MKFSVAQNIFTTVAIFLFNFDDRIIIVAPKEESTVEASGEENEDEAPESDGSDGPTSETVQGVKIKFKSSAQDCFILDG